MHHSVLETASMSCKRAEMRNIIYSLSKFYLDLILNNVEAQYNTVLMIEVSMRVSLFFPRMMLQSKPHFLLNMNNNNNEE